MLGQTTLDQLSAAAARFEAAHPQGRMTAIYSVQLNRACHELGKDALERLRDRGWLDESELDAFRALMHAMLIDAFRESDGASGEAEANAFTERLLASLRDDFAGHRGFIREYDEDDPEDPLDLTLAFVENDTLHTLYIGIVFS